MVCSVTVPSESPLTDFGNFRDHEEPLGIYVHWPYCLSKCPYCDFNSHVAESLDHDRWADADARDLTHVASRVGPRHIGSVFFGGGTPSLMAPKTIERVLRVLDDNFSGIGSAEVTLEANPTSVESAQLAGFLAAGVNRVSIGVQALLDEDLRFLGRQHSAEEAIAAVQTARRLFDRVSFDLIYARPGQSVASWHAELRRAFEFAADHLSLYQLTIEAGTPFHAFHARGDFQVPDEDLAADLYEVTQELTAAAGLPAYEISNHAAHGAEAATISSIGVRETMSASDRARMDA